MSPTGVGAGDGPGGAVVAKIAAFFESVQG